MIKLDLSEKCELFERVAAAAFDKLALKGDCVVEVDFVSKEEIRDLNLSARGVDRVTDVLSFPALDEIKAFTPENYPFDYDGVSGSVNIGNIVICAEVAKEQAAEYGHSEERERAYLFLHGLLHLLGYDHIEESDKAVMRAKEEEILSALGITRE